ncbi:MAG: glycosyltransferase [Cyclobacteriaceae bacterium]
MIFVAGSILILYCIFIAWILISWFYLKGHEEENADLLGTSVNMLATVLVPVRNEEVGIYTTIHSILNNKISNTGYEIIVIDDHSTDQTVLLVEELCRKHDQVKLISLPNGVGGKKSAIEMGVHEAKGELILCTDGDCEVPKNWVNNYLETYNGRGENIFLFGPVKYKSNGRMVHDFLNIELSVLVVIGGATMANGIPTMLNGANLSYRKEAFTKVGGYQGNREIPSGDDEFLLRKMDSKFPNGVRFLKNPDAIVLTDAPKSLRELVSQRRRWAAKWKHHTGFFSSFIPLLIFMANTCAIVAMACVLLGYYRTECLGFLGMKALFDFTIMKVSTRFLRVNYGLFYWALLEIIYPFYVVFFGIASNFGKYSWKGREYETNLATDQN